VISAVSIDPELITAHPESNILICSVPAKWIPRHWVRRRA